MFFGTPHSRSEDPKFWYNAATILKYNSRVRGKDVITLDIANVLAEACRSFETAFDRIPVLSVYETQVTRVSRHVKSKGVLVRQILIYPSLTNLINKYRLSVRLVVKQMSDGRILLG